jgi:glycosyltransferase involved in cell wall biosynthesis
MSWEYDVVGFLRGDFGLSVAARNTVRALAASGRTVNLVPVEPKVLKGPAAGISAEGRNPGSRRLNLFQVNPVEIALFSRQWRGAVEPGAPNVCVPFWELPLVPRAWEPVLQAMDLVFAPTRFVEEACRTAVPAGRVLHYPQAVFLPDGIRPDREAWGFPLGVTVFVLSFDLGSDIERKNPWMAIEAFRRAFPTEPNVRLALKTRPWAGVRAHAAQVEALRARVGEDRRIRIVDKALPYKEVLGLYASCDVLLSLHRSEGLGLHLMEAMSLGKVVVATNWSGNTDFMTRGNSIPVGYRLIPAAPAHANYRAEVGRAGQSWAEPNLEEAVAALRGLRARPEHRAALGEAAARDMEERRLEMLSGRAFDLLESRIAARSPLPSRLRKALRTARLRGWWREVKSLLLAVARRG